MSVDTDITTEIITLSSSDFEEKRLKFDELFLVDFYADWCAPCKAMIPHLNATLERVKDRVKIGKINTETYKEIAQIFQITSVPTLVMFYQGQQVDRHVGVMSKDRLLLWLQETADLSGLNPLFR